MCCLFLVISNLTKGLKKMMAAFEAAKEKAE